MYTVIHTVHTVWIQYCDLLCILVVPYVCMYFTICMIFIHFQTHPNMFGHHHHHGNGSGDSGKDADAMDTSLDGKGTHHHNYGACCDGHTHQVSTSSSCKSDSVSTTAGNSTHGNGTGTGSDSNTGDSGGSQKRYCRCCYCELFGPNGVSFTVHCSVPFHVLLLPSDCLPTSATVLATYVQMRTSGDMCGSHCTVV